MSAELQKVKKGDMVTRMLGGEIPMLLKVHLVTNDFILCGPYKFDRKTGAEIDEDREWGPPPLMTGSFLAPATTTFAKEAL